MEFRIGINLGDVIDDGKTIYGDGVNIAARLEGLADAGGVMISGSVYDQVHNKVEALFVDEGRRRVKNIPEPIRTYTIVPRPAEAAYRAALRRRRAFLYGSAVAASVAIVIAIVSWQVVVRGRVGPSGPSISSAANVQVLRDCPECPELVVVPAGTYRRGSAPDDEGHIPSEGPAAEVQIVKPFAIGRYEVTFAQWDACAADNACSQAPTDRGWGRGTRPVIYVSWQDIHEYLNWLRQEFPDALISQSPPYFDEKILTW